MDQQVYKLHHYREIDGFNSVLSSWSRHTPNQQCLWHSNWAITQPHTLQANGSLCPLIPVDFGRISYHGMCEDMEAKNSRTSSRLRMPPCSPPPLMLKKSLFFLWSPDGIFRHSTDVTLCITMTRVFVFIHIYLFTVTSGGQRPCQSFCCSPSADC